MSNDKKACEKKTKSCILYSEPNSGDLLGTITNNKQCKYIGDECKEITIDNNCQIDTDNNQYTKKTDVNFNEVKNK